MSNLIFLGLFIYKKTNSLLSQFSGVLIIMPFIKIEYHSFRHATYRRKIDMSEIINEIKEDIHMKLISDGYLPNEDDSDDDDDYIRKSLNSKVCLGLSCYKAICASLISNKLLYLSECNKCASKIQGNLAEFDSIYKCADQLEQKYNASFKEGIDNLKKFFDYSWEKYKHSEKGIIDNLEEFFAYNWEKYNEEF